MGGLEAPMYTANPARLPQIQVLYRDHHGWLTAWLRRRLGNTGDVADLASPGPSAVKKAKPAEAFAGLHGQGKAEHLAKVKLSECAHPPSSIGR